MAHFSVKQLSFLHHKIPCHQNWRWMNFSCNLLSCESFLIRFFPTYSFSIILHKFKNPPFSYKISISGAQNLNIHKNTHSLFPPPIAIPSKNTHLNPPIIQILPFSFFLFFPHQSPFSTKSPPDQPTPPWKTPTSPQHSSPPAKSKSLSRKKKKMEKNGQLCPPILTRADCGGVEHTYM